MQYLILSIYLICFLSAKQKQGYGQTIVAYYNTVFAKSVDFFLKFHVFQLCVLVEYINFPLNTNVYMSN